MAERKRKDYSQRAYDVVAKATGMPTSSDLARARAGGKARKAKLTPQQRSDIARKAAEARWANRQATPAPQIVKLPSRKAREA